MGLDQLLAGDTALLGGQNLALEQLFNANRQGRSALSGARSGINRAIGQGRGDIQAGRTGALDFLSSGFDTARADLAGLDAGGVEAIDLQAQLSGAMGPEAQQMAMDSVMRSPEFDFIREQGLREVNANAAATGGTGGGEFMRDLTRFGQGLASQRFDTAYGRLGQVGQRGLQVGGMRSNLASMLAGQQAGVETGAANALSALMGQQASAEGQLGAAGVNLASQMGTAGANVGMQTGANRANLFNVGAGMMQNAGFQGADLTSRLAGQGASSMMQGGQLSAGLYQNMAQLLSGGRMQAGQSIADSIARQSQSQAGYIDEQGRLVGGTIDQGISNLANMLSGAGTAEAADLIRMAELYQALASQDAAAGSGAIGNAGAAAANAQLAQGQNISNLASNLAGAFGTYRGANP